MFEAIKPGDVIWDVGANVGYYTRKFSDSVGPAGQVFAFEPFPATAARLRADIDRGRNRHRAACGVGGGNRHSIDAGRGR